MTHPLSSVSLLLAALLLMTRSFAATAFQSMNNRRLQRTGLISQRRKSSPTAVLLGAAPANGESTSTTETTETSEKNTKTSPPQQPVGRVVRQTAVLDGAEWVSVRNRLLLQMTDGDPKKKDPPAYARTVQGVFTVVSGSVEGKRVVGMQVLNENYLSDDQTEAIPLDQDSSITLYKESIAEIPNGVSEDAAVWTLLQALSIVHCALPVLPNVGGSGSSQVVKDGKVVVLGSNPVAVTAASALSKLNFSVTMVSMEKPSDLPAAVTHMAPAVGELELGFSAVLDQFDSLLDTLGDEHDDSPGMRGGVTGLLAQRHGCNVYASTLTESQTIVTDSGLLFGPGKTKEHIQKLQKRSAKATAAQFPSPTGLGQTIQSLLEAGVTLPAPKEAAAGSVYVRGWSLKDFWEYTRWPRDASGTNKRYGLPVVEELGSLSEDEDDDGPMISAPPFRGSEAQSEPEVSEEDEKEAANNPYVMMVSGVKGLQEQIVGDEMTGILFLSAPFCRTCRYLKPQYQRMARRYNEDAEYHSDAEGSNKDFIFAKAEATGKIGKDLGKALGCDSVPSFLLFNKGRMYGRPLAVSRLPSKKLDMAVSALREGKRWDESKFVDDDDDEDGLRGGAGNASRGSRKKLY